MTSSWYKYVCIKCHEDFYATHEYIKEKNHICPTCLKNSKCY